jgi:UDP-N-acetylglucosamine 2-epimerase (non-hydrolysing)
MSIAICFGTRPEIIKLAPVISELKKQGIPYKTIFTGQHKELYEDVKFLIDEPDYRLEIMKHNQSLNDILSSISLKLPAILKEIDAKLLIVQGDTSTVLTAALVAFHEKIKVGHVEAGLRTHDIYNPYPEEANRQLVSRIAHFNWAPTNNSKQNLLNEGIQNVSTTGNTVIDTCQSFDFPILYKKKILITLHRRENFGVPMEKMFREIEELAKENPQFEFIFPMHPNPHVQKLKPLLSSVKIIDPLGYKEMIELLSSCFCVISDSGGIQEECGAFNKRILVCRTTTERPEGVTAGFAKLIGTEIKSNFDWVTNPTPWEGENPYGSGKASQKIVEEISEFLNNTHE